VTVNTGISVPEGTTVTITGSKLTAAGDASDPASEFVYTITAAPTHGTLKLNGNALTVNGTFTQDDINNSKVTYTHDGTDNNDSFNFSVADSPGAAATGTFALNFPEAPAPITANTGLTLGEGTTATLTGSMLNAVADAVDPPSELVYTIT